MRASRRRRAACALVSGALLALARGVGAQQGAPPADPVPAHDTLTIVSRATGETRHALVHVPAGHAAAATARLPVLYMPDGGVHEDFPHVVATVDSLVALGRIRPVLVVGIPNTERRRDLTGPTRFARDSAIAPRVGHSAAFRRFVREELIPAVEARYRTTTERAIVGESLAGLFVVETLVLEPGLFAHHVALDPSLWWDGGALVDSARARLAARGTTGARALPRRALYLASSGEPEIAAQTARLAAVLREAGAPEGAWTYAPRPELTHATIFRALEAEALVWALR